MPIEPGTRLGPYEIVAPIGSVGMGEVYREKHTRLDRDVAIKVLPAQSVGDAQAESRFDREARAIAALVDHAINLADALDIAHARGMLHRDLKPANLVGSSCVIRA